MKYSAVDADGHIIERRSDLTRYGVLADATPGIDAMLDRETLEAWVGGYAPGISYGLFDPAQRLKDMDREGIEVAVNFPTPLLGVSDFTDPGSSYQACRAFNDYYADSYRQQDAGRFFAPALVPMQAVDLAVEELERAVREHGAIGVFVPPYSGDLHLDDLAYDPLYAKAQELNVPILVHGSRHTVEPVFLPHRFKSQVRFHALVFPFQNMIALGDIVCGGVLERFPKLKVAILESGVGWIPHFMARLDEDYERMPEEEPWLKAKPSEYIRSGRVWVSCDPDEEIIEYVADVIGEESIIFASDYPHWDCRFPNSANIIRESALSEELKRRILVDNVRALYNL